MCFELSWKVLKDFLEYQGYENIDGPRSVIKEAFNLGLIENGHLWLELLKDKNYTTHVYNEETANDIYQKIFSNYFQLFKQLHTILNSKLSNQ